MRWLPIVFTIIFLSVAAARASGEATYHYGNTASWYGPGLYGNTTSCGKTLTKHSRWVAALRSNLAHCGMKVLVCHRSHCQTVTVQDRGAWRSDGRAWDLTHSVKRRLGCGSVCLVRWKRGW